MTCPKCTYQGQQASRFRYESSTVLMLLLIMRESSGASEASSSCMILSEIRAVQDRDSHPTTLYAAKSYNGGRVPTMSSKFPSSCCCPCINSSLSSALGVFASLLQGPHPFDCRAATCCVDHEMSIAFDHVCGKEEKWKLKR